MATDVSLIPQNRVENLLSKLSEIENNISNIGTDLTNNLVHKTGNETITGNKTFTDYNILQSLNADISDTTNSYSFGTNYYKDKNGNAYFYTKAYQDTNRYMFEVAGNYGTNTWKNGLQVGYDRTNEKMFARIPTPSASDSSTQIATTSCVDNKINNKINSQLTNTIINMPNDIKLVLNNDGTITLKAGSKVYIPNGANNYDTYITPSDISIGYNYQVDANVFYNKTSNSLFVLYTNQCFTGATQPSYAASNGFLWWDNTNNRINFSNNGGSTWVQQGNISLPIGIIRGANQTNKPGCISSIKQIFNGIGYMDKIQWFLPGIEALYPDGWNDDGSYKNKKVTTSSVLLNTYDYKAVSQQVLLYTDGVNCSICRSDKYSEDELMPENLYCAWYNPNENIFRYSSESSYTYAKTCLCLCIDSISTNDNFRIIDCHIRYKTGLKSVSSPYVTNYHWDSSSSNNLWWYRAWSNGFIEQGGRVQTTMAAAGAQYTFYVPFKQSYSITATLNEWAGSWSAEAMCRIIETSLSAFTIQCGGNGNNPGYVSWYACGY